MTESLQKLRSSLRASMWMWALYWPLGGLMLLAGGMRDPASIAFLFLVLFGFVLMLASGVLKSQGPRTVRTVIAAKPVYVALTAVAVLLLGSILDFVANVGLWVFSASYLGSLALAIVRLRSHVRSEGKTWRSAGADQLLALLCASLLFAIPLFLDMLLQSIEAGSLGTAGNVVVILNLLNVAYPALLLAASRPFRLDLPLARPPPVARTRVRLRFVREEF